MEITLEKQSIWPIWKKVLFRLFTIFAILYIIPFPLGLIPWVNKMGTWYADLWHAIVPWAGEHILALEDPISVRPNGSGDTTYNYVQLFLMVLLSLIGGAIWSLLDRRRENYDKFLEWLSVYVRFYLFSVLLSYGMYKIIKTQFPFPGLEQLVLPFGHSSPMGLAWKFMGYSEGYNLFTGLGEAIAGTLLISRRTTTLGAIVGVCVMANVVMINFCYDVPVKLFSSVLLFFLMFLLLLDYKRLLNLLILNKSAEPLEFKPHFKDRAWEITTQVIKYVLSVALIVSTAVQIYPYLKQFGSLRPKPPLYGIYEVEKFVKNGTELPPLLTDKERWKRLIIDYPGRAVIHKMKDQRSFYTFEADTSKMEIVHYLNQDTTRKGLLNYSWASDSLLVLDGTSRGDTVYIELKPFDLEQFNLINRGFNWINEYPYNR